MRTYTTAGTSAHSAVAPLLPSAPALSYDFTPDPLPIPIDFALLSSAKRKKSDPVHTPTLQVAYRREQSATATGRYTKPKATPGYTTSTTTSTSRDQASRQTHERKMTIKPPRANTAGRSAPRQSRLGSEDLKNDAAGHPRFHSTKTNYKYRPSPRAEAREPNKYEKYHTTCSSRKAKQPAIDQPSKNYESQLRGYSSKDGTDTASPNNDSKRDSLTSQSTATTTNTTPPVSPTKMPSVSTAAFSKKRSREEDPESSEEEDGPIFRNGKFVDKPSKARISPLLAETRAPHHKSKKQKIQGALTTIIATSSKKRAHDEDSESSSSEEDGPIFRNGEFVDEGLIAKKPRPENEVAKTRTTGRANKRQKIEATTSESTRSAQPNKRSQRTKEKKTKPARARVNGAKRFIL